MQDNARKELNKVISEIFQDNGWTMKFINDLSREACSTIMTSILTRMMIEGIPLDDVITAVKSSYEMFKEMKDENRKDITDYGKNE